jgi:hypothetical protein
LEHIFFADGNLKKISWIVKTADSIDEEMREHVEQYLDKVTLEQSKYIAVHVGIFWSIGRFIIKNEDTVNVMLDSKKMFEHLSQNKASPDEFIQNRTWFLNELINQRKLKVHYHLINSEENLAKKLI